MDITTVSLKLNGSDLIAALEDAGEKLESMQGEMILDFSSVRRISPAAVSAMSDFADNAEERSVHVVLRSVNVDVYRVLKLARLAERFSLVN